YSPATSRPLPSTPTRRSSDLIRSFIDQPGVPLVSARAACDAGAPPAIELRQRRFVPAGLLAPPQRWKIPVCVAHGAAGDRKRTRSEERRVGKEWRARRAPDPF